MKTVLTIAGFDPSSGAGVTADLMVFAAHGMYGTSCITALTVQSTVGVRATSAIPTEWVSDTLQCLDGDLPPAGIKIGMLPNATNTIAISHYCAKYKLSHPMLPIVFDPVLRSTSGRELASQGAIRAIGEYLLPVVDWITPNLEELILLSRMPINQPESIAEAAKVLQQTVARLSAKHKLGIIVTGGHSDPPDDYMITPQGEEFWFPGTKIETTSTHGTGCAFSSAFLSRLVLGDTPYNACVAAKGYVAGAMTNAPKLGKGFGPINHLWNRSKSREQV